jgi:hypothetical protein
MIKEKIIMEEYIKQEAIAFSNFKIKYIVELRNKSEFKYTVMQFKGVTDGVIWEAYQQSKTK